MGSFSIWHWLILVIWVGFLYCLVGIPTYKILTRTGHLGSASILAAIPGVNIIVLWYFAFKKWPIDPELGELHKSSELTLLLRTS